MKLGWMIVFMFLFSPQPLSVHAEEPISMEVLLDGVPVQYGGWVLTVPLEAHTHIPAIRLMVEHSEGLEVTAGEPFWEGTLPTGREHIFEISMSLIQPPPQSVTVLVRGRTQDGTLFEKTIVRPIE